MALVCCVCMERRSMSMSFMYCCLYWGSGFLRSNISLHCCVLHGRMLGASRLIWSSFCQSTVPQPFYQNKWGDDHCLIFQISNCPFNHSGAIWCCSCSLKGPVAFECVGKWIGCPFRLSFYSPLDLYINLVVKKKHFVGFPLMSSHRQIDGERNAFYHKWKLEAVFSKLSIFLNFFLSVYPLTVPQMGRPMGPGRR